LKSLDFRNLDDDQRFAGTLTTTEFLAKFIHGNWRSDLPRNFAAS
jgi:hypothetical protein